MSFFFFNFSTFFFLFDVLQLTLVSLLFFFFSFFLSFQITPLKNLHLNNSHWYMGGGKPMRFCAVSDFDAKFVSEAEELETARERERQLRMMPKSSPSSSSSSSPKTEDESSRVASMMRQMQEETRLAAAAAAKSTPPVVVAAGDPLLCDASPDTKKGLVRCRASRLAREVWASPANLRRCEDWWRGVPVL